MREIIFRGKRAENGKWVYGAPIPPFSYKYLVEMRNNYEICEDVLVDTIGQYTGINDRNGKRIFEGDIIRAVAEGEEETYVVEWRGNDRYPAFDLKPQPDCDSNGLSYLLWVEAEIEVIGNIYDNPELLERNRESLAEV